MVSGTRLLALAISFCSLQVVALTLAGKPQGIIRPYKREPLQDLVTWDEHSLFVRGERIMFYSGEFHPFRLPVPDLWLDVFQKIKALGYNGVSFYVDWNLLEGSPGSFTAEGVFAWEPFFDAATEAGIYLIARPGPYINAEASGGGFPGWLARVPDILRTNQTGFLTATDNYVANIGAIVAKAQITNGGPVVLVQPENEYTYVQDGILFPDNVFMEYVMKQYRDAGIVVPFISNDASPNGNFAPGKPAAVDIYGHDGYPLGFDCANPTVWPAGRLPTTWRRLHLQQSPSTAYSILEFQGGSFDPWGGPGFEKCVGLLNHEFERVFYKNDFSFGVAIFNIYMTYGGTNWGNLGHPGGYTSYDYGSVIEENRAVTREKYSEAKLEANFLQASPAYLTATPGNVTNGAYTGNNNIAVTRLTGNTTNFYVVRHADYQSLDTTSYTLTVSTSIGDVTVPQLNGSLSLGRRDSKIHVTDYDVGGVNLIYSSAEIFSWKKSGPKIVLIVYGGEGETHELALPSGLGTPTVEGIGVTVSTNGSAIIANWQVTSSRRVLHFGGILDIYLLWRNDAYNYWVLELPAEAPIGNYSSPSKDFIIAKAGYLLRTASVSGDSLYLTGDLNATADFELISAPSGIASVYFNGERVSETTLSNNTILGTLTYTQPQSLNLPSLTDLEWKYLDSLPEIQPNYDDSLWTSADQTTTNNTVRALTTPKSLYASDYGYHTGSLIYRGHFTSTGNESVFSVNTQGGSAFGHSVWLNSTFLGSFTGYDAAASYNQTFRLPPLLAGGSYVFTVVIDHMGLNENWTPGEDEMKTPRGILDYTLSGHPKSDIAWVLTGNLGGEKYADLVRGPLNEGALYAERQGYHQPSPPSTDWETGSPFEGIPGPGIAFYTTTFELAIPRGYDVPLRFLFSNGTAADGTPSDFRAQLFVNGYQFGKYINNIGPQLSFPVPEGILNHAGPNTLGITLWAQGASGASLTAGFQLVADAAFQTGFSRPRLSPAPEWVERRGAY